MEANQRGVARGARVSCTSALRWVVVSAVVCIIPLLARPAHAYAWMIRHGFAECGGCHVDPMGGETLTGMGRVTGESLLAQPWAADAPSELALLAFGVEEPADVRLGGSLRLLAPVNLETERSTLFPMQVDAYGAAFFGRFVAALSLGAARASPRLEHASLARVLGASRGDGLLLVSRNHWLGYRIRDEWLVRAGRMNLPFGLRTPEHTLWARAETATDRESDQLHGVSVAFTQGRVRGELMLALGNLQVSQAAFQRRGYSAHVEVLLARRLAVGASSLVLAAPRELEVDRGAVWRQAHGLTLRHSPWRPLVVLAEANVLSNPRASLGYVGTLTLDVEPLQGLHLGGTLERLDRGRSDGGGSANGDGRARTGKWLTINWFFGPHLDLRLDFVRRDNRSDMLLGQLHVYL